MKAGLKCSSVCKERIGVNCENVPQFLYEDDVMEDVETDDETYELEENDSLFKEEVNLGPNLCTYPESATQGTSGDRGTCHIKTS